MADPTPQDRADAIREPMAGDVWQTGRLLQTVVRFDFPRSLIHYISTRDKHETGTTIGLKAWRDWCATATLIRRGA